jgi:Bacterial low temperature requirement A protein (LtrA)
MLIIWWMYDGFAWMTNTVAPSDPVRRALLLMGTGGFLLIALSLPKVFAEDGWAFGAGYFLVNLIHSGAPGGLRISTHPSKLTKMFSPGEFVLRRIFSTTGCRARCSPRSCSTTTRAYCCGRPGEPPRGTW